MLGKITFSQNKLINIKWNKKYIKFARIIRRNFKKYLFLVKNIKWLE